MRFGRLFMLATALSLITSVCKAGTVYQGSTLSFLFSGKFDEIDNFWQWFQKNEQRLRQFESDPNKYLNELLNHARSIKPGLAIELETPKNGIINMTISADGDRELFPIVQTIVERAPAVEGWNIIAFRQRLTKEQLMEVRVKAGPLELNPSELKFYPLIDKDMLDVIVYVKGVNEENFNHIAYGGLLLLDNILGEYDCVTKVRSYDFHEMPVTKEGLEGLLPLLELPVYVDRFHTVKH